MFFFQICRFTAVNISLADEICLQSAAGERCIVGMNSSGNPTHFDDVGNKTVLVKNLLKARRATHLGRFLEQFLLKTLFAQKVFKYSTASCTRPLVSMSPGCCFLYVLSSVGLCVSV